MKKLSRMLPELRHPSSVHRDGEGHVWEHFCLPSTPLAIVKLVGTCGKPQTHASGLPQMPQVHPPITRATLEEKCRCVGRK